MKEKFSEYESLGFLNQEGTFLFEIKSYELKPGKDGKDPCATFEVESKTGGKSTLWHSLSPKARWSYNNLIKACLALTPDDIDEFEFDYETDGRTLVGKFFLGEVTKESYKKAIKVPNDDGTFTDAEEEKTAYKITKYSPVNNDSIDESLPF